jgi:hypothetical protein
MRPRSEFTARKSISSIPNKKKVVVFTQDLSGREDLPREILWEEDMEA